METSLLAVSTDFSACSPHGCARPGAGREQGITGRMTGYSAKEP